MAFGVLLMGILLGFTAAATLLPSDVGLLTIGLSYAVVGTLTFMSVVFFAILGEDDGEGAESD